jgi:heat shock protein HslJ
MNKLIYLIVIIIPVVSLLGCTEKNADQKGELSEEKTKEVKENIVDRAHNSMISLDWDGVYLGILPCADCEGIRTALTLNKDMSFKLETIYIGKSEDVFYDSGTFKWSDDGGSIQLNNANNTRYQVGENRLMQLDMDGNRIEGDLSEKYTLRKIKIALTEIYWKLVELKGQEVTYNEKTKTPAYLVFLEEDSRIAGSGSCNRIMGGYSLEEGNRLRFSKIASTMMACPDMELEDQFLKIFEEVDNYAINVNTLSLNKAKMAPLARFEAVYVKSPKFD